MDSSISLQPAFGYGLAPVVVLAIFLITTLIITIVKKSGKDLADQELPPIKPPVFAKLNREETRLLYITKLNKLEKQLLDGSVTPRACFQDLSLLFRKFIKDYTGHEVTNKTLAELKGMNIPGVAVLVEEYYEPEFGEDPQADARMAIDKTKRVIRTWN